MSMEAPKFLIAAGGTGGHVYPAIAIADALKQLKKSSQILFVGTRDRMEWDAVPKAGYKIESIWISGFHRRLTLKNLTFPLKLLVSMNQSRNILNSFQPDIVLSCGGFAAGPVGWAAAKKKIPVCIQEQNSYPGWTNRKLGPKAERVYTAFEEAESFFRKETVRMYGNPVRTELGNLSREKAAEIWNLSPAKRTLLVIGGSGGALTINRAMKKHLKQLHDKLGVQIIWQCGKEYYKNIIDEINPVDFPNLRLQPYIDDMGSAYAMADLAVSRAGAISCAELTLTATPALLIPSPNVAGDHQTKNALGLVNQGAASLIQDDEAEEKLANRITDVFAYPDYMKKMKAQSGNMAKPDAARHIAEDMLSLITQKSPAVA